MSLAKLYVTVGADTAEFQKKMEGMQKNLHTVGQRIGDTGKTMTKWVTGPIVGAAAGLGAIITKTANAGDGIQKMALRTGFSTEALSEYKHAAELSGASIDTVEKAVKRMQKGLLDAERGMKTATDSLDALGLSVADLQGLSPEQQFDKMAMALAEIEDPSLRAALAQEVFGRAGTELLPMLAAGADGIEEMREEARRLGIVFDQEAADAAAKFNDDVDRLKKGFAGAFQEIGMKFMPMIVDDLLPALQEKLVPAVSRLAERIGNLADWFRNLDPWVQKLIVGAIGFAAAAGPIMMILGPTIKLVSTLIPLIKTLGVVFVFLTSPIGLVVAAIAGAIAIGYLLWKNWDNIKDKISELWQKFADWFGNLWQRIKDATIGRIKDIADGIRERFSKIIDWATDKWDRFKNRISDIWHGIGDGIRGSINRIIDFLNRMIRGMNRLKFDIPDWVPLIGGKSWGFNLGEIPKLHTGTQYFMPPGGQREGLALLERGEQVIPRGEAAQSLPPIQLTVYLDSRVISQQLYELQETRGRALGVT